MDDTTERARRALHHLFADFTGVSAEYMTRQVLDALTEAGLSLVTTEDVGICHDAAFHQAQYVTTEYHRTKYRELAARLYETILKSAATGEIVDD